MKLSFVLLVVSNLQCLAKPAKNNEILTRFHRITDVQYDAILGLTSGEPVISEAPLIANLKLGSSLSWLPSYFSSIASTKRNNTKEVWDIQYSYPLSVVKNHGDEHAIDENNMPQRVSPIVKCIMVVQQHNKEEEKDKEGVGVGEAEAEEQINKPSYTPYAQANPYIYPWNSSFFHYPAQHQPNNYESSPNELKHFIPYYRFYPSHYDTSYENHDTTNFSHKKPSTCHKKKIKRCKNQKRNPRTHYNYENKDLPTVKPRKIKRDQYSKNGPQPPNYKKMSTYLNQGYQPAYYPQLSYHSQYPKVAYSISYNYPAPVYIGTTPKPYLE